MTSRRDSLLFRAVFEELLHIFAFSTELLNFEELSLIIHIGNSIKTLEFCVCWSLDIGAGFVDLTLDELHFCFSLNLFFLGGGILPFY